MRDTRHMHRYVDTPERAALLRKAKAIVGDGASVAAAIDAALKSFVAGAKAALSATPPEPIGARLKRARVAAGLTQEALGDVCGGYSRATVVACENAGRPLPDPIAEWLKGQEVSS